ncbi:hypothetical protein CVIRNUC_009456 [Coccomyxa viridis]|uniref:Flavin-containing monooxygenase n=1 Tax=Coccomyxa viridis TaxID=1274662 RepID=A0AAV1IFZ4_9CHLO|nr:hypothetical protein CVIRNUC_009456 [Coccomyxa viridis]
MGPTLRSRVSSQGVDQIPVVIIGGGICGLLAAERCVREGISFTLFERNDDFGGNWVVRANKYSHLQAHAALYQWDKHFALDKKSPFSKVAAPKVLETIRGFAEKYHIGKNTRFGTEVTTVTRKSDRSVLVSYTVVRSGETGTVCASSLFVASGILGQQVSLQGRGLPSTKAFKGISSFAGRHQGVECSLGIAGTAEGKDVVILGTGAFALEAMEAADRGDARSITLIARPRDRWIIPYSQQFKFVFLATGPFTPRWLACWLINVWMGALYRRAGIAHMQPAFGSAHNFTGQCNDALFQLALQGRVQCIVDKVTEVQETAVVLESGAALPCDVLINAQGCEVMYQPPYLAELGLDFRKDLHNFAFLGRSPRIGTASDWVWYNVPHGPQKQVESFFQGQRCIREGREQEFVDALQPTPFSGCKGESLVAANPSGFKARNAAYRRTMLAGRAWWDAAWTRVKLESSELGTWLLCAVMCGAEACALSGWLASPDRAASSKQPGKP